MSELLELANRLIEAREMAKGFMGGDWELDGIPDEVPSPSDAQFIFIVLAGNHAVDIIKGYQELLRKAADTLEACAGYGHGLWSEKLDGLAGEIRSSIPERE